MDNFNILYWNTHFMVGSIGKDGINKMQAATDSVIIKLLNIAFEKYRKIDAIIFTEAYPQYFNNKEDYIVGENCNDNILLYLKKKNYVLNDNINKVPFNKLVDTFKSDSGDYIPFRWSEEKRKERKKYHQFFTNGVLIFTQKSDWKVTDYSITNPDLLVIENNDLALAGIRIVNYGVTGNEMEQQFKSIINKIDINKKTIYIGDFNINDTDEKFLANVPYSYKKIINENLFDINKQIGFEICDDNTIGNRKMDYLFLNKCKKIKFEAVHPTMNELYGNNNFVNNFCDVLEIKQPFPDHNLLFASIDLGGE